MRGSVRPLRFGMLLFGALGFAGGVFACALQDGGIAPVEAGDAAASGNNGDATTDGAFAKDGTGPDAPGDETTPIFDSGSDAGPPRYIYASTNAGIYSLELTSRVLHEITTISGCGITSAFTNADIAVDMSGLVHILAWSPGAYRYYALEQDGGCVDVHGVTGASGSTTTWFGYQKVATDYIASDTVGSRTIGITDQNSNYIGSFNDVLPASGATADLACSPTLCYTALTHDRCPGDAGTADCLFAFTVNGSTAQQVGDFGRAGVVGMAYDSGYVYGFFADGSVVEVSVTPGSTGHPFPYTRSGGPPTWQGAGSSSGNP